MNNIKKIIIGIFLIVLVSGAIFFLIKERTKKIITNFAQSYKATYTANNNFLTDVVVTNVGENKTVTELQNCFKQLLNSLDSDVSNSDRITLTETCLIYQNEIDVELSASDITEQKANDALLDLNTKAASIKNKDLQSQAFEIVDASQNYFDVVKKYKTALSDKNDQKKELLNNIINDNGITSDFISYLNNKDNQTKIDMDNEILNNSDFVTIDTKMQQGFARFKGSVGI